jgi:uncharacterized protein (TIGR00255 family)
MTGFGKVLCTIKHSTFSFEIKSLNSKQIEINLKNANLLKDIEMDLRRQIQQKLIRGKIDVTISEEISENSQLLNFDYLEKLYNEIVAFGKNKNINTGDVFPTVLKLNEYNKNHNLHIEEAERAKILDVMNKGLDALVDFRKKEGAVLEQDIADRVALIQQLQTEITPFEQNRISKIRERIEIELAQLKNIEVDRNRLEQEIIYYLEKLDITEENIRLQAHCAYFMEVIHNNQIEKGKKLAFIAQEIGREINTIGSKANDAAIQKIVVQMKDELEKIKEQLNNIL